MATNSFKRGQMGVKEILRIETRRDEDGRLEKRGRSRKREGKKVKNLSKSGKSR